MVTYATAFVAVGGHNISPLCHDQVINNLWMWKVSKTKTLSGGSLGSCIEEEQSKLCDLS